MYFVIAIADFSPDALQQPQQQQQTDNQAEEQQAKQDESTNQQESEKQQNQSKQSGYLSFKQGDKLLVKYTFESGWWYGSVIEEGKELDELTDGYFPSNYTQAIQVEKPKAPPPPPSKNSEKNEEKDWKSYAQGLIEQENRKKLIHDIANQQKQLENAKTQVNVEREESVKKEQQNQYDFQLLQQAAQAENQMAAAQSQIQEVNYQRQLLEKRHQQSQQQTYEDMDPSVQMEFGVQGYKKIKITSENKESLLNNSEVRYSEGNDYAIIPIKEQTQLARSHRQLNHYFNYDKWNEQINQQGGIKRAKADPSKKKDKKNKALEKLLKM